MTFLILWLISGVLTSTVFLGDQLLDEGGIDRDDIVLAAALIVLGPITAVLMWVDRSA